MTNNLPSNRFVRAMGGMVSFWKTVRTTSVAEIVAECERPAHVAVVGSDGDFAVLIERLGRERPAQETYKQTSTIKGPANDQTVDVRLYVGRYETILDAPANSAVIDATVVRTGEGALAQALATIVVERPELRLTLARHIPAFRPAVATQLVQEMAWVNARIAVLSALPGIIPLTDILLPAAALGDIMLLTKNQVLLLLKIAAAYGLAVDLRSRTRELLPVVGGAFGWRAIARELIGLVPGGVGVVVKGAVAYAGTYTVGKAASIYYSTGVSLPKPRLKRLYLDSYKSSWERLKSMWRRGRSSTELASAIVAGSVVKELGPSRVENPNPGANISTNTGTEVDKQVNVGV